MRVLITGGAGFIGTHLANALHRQGHYVRVLDDMRSGDASRLDPDIFVKRGDVRDVPTLWTVLQDVEVVYHLAALVSVPASVLYPRDYNDVNVGGTVALLEACRDVGHVKRVILASSATVYGDQEHQPVHEELRPRPAVPYAVSKLAAEHYLFTLGRLVGFQAVALRIFNAYGPGAPLPPSHAPIIPYAMRQISQKGSVIVFGDGTQTRDFVYIDDVVEALVAAATAPQVDGQVINVGSGQETSVNDLVATIGRVVEQRPRILYNREASPGIPRLVADLERAHAILGYRPRVSLEAGLRRFYETDPRFRRGRRSTQAPLTDLALHPPGL